jgi:peptidoglycan/LPS O-acetylase OafA/YrhL
MGLLRLFLAISVVIAHTTPFLSLQLMPSFVAVRLFFLISEFYMALVLSAKYRGPNHVSVFYINRFLRLFPAYIIAALVMAILYVMAADVPGAPEQSLLVTEIRQHAAGQPGQLGLLSLIGMLIPNLFIFGSDLVYLFHHTAAGWSVTFGIDPVGQPEAVRGSIFLLLPAAWSIGIELWFYLLAPLLTRLKTSWIVALGVGSLALHLGMDAWKPWANYCFFPAALWFFMGGILAHRAWQSGWFKRVDHRTVWTVAVTALGLLFLREFIPGYRNYPAPIYLTLAVALPFIFEAFRKVAWDRWIGNLSYPVYLLHAAVIVVAHNYFGSLNFLPIIVVTLALSLLVNLGVEEPLERFRQRRAMRGLQGAQA